MNKIIVVAGYLAAGKSTFARRLSQALNIPCIVKDTFKNALCSGVKLADRDESSRFSAVAFDGILYVTERLLEVGQPVIIEGNFVPKGLKKVDEAGALKTLIERYDCKTLTFRFIGDTRVLHQRFVERDKLPERGLANMLFQEITFDEFDRDCRNLDAFDVGGMAITVDGTDFEAVDFEEHIKTARQFITARR